MNIWRSVCTFSRSWSSSRLFLTMSLLKPLMCCKTLLHTGMLPIQPRCSEGSHSPHCGPRVGEGRTACRDAVTPELPHHTSLESEKPIEVTVGSSDDTMGEDILVLGRRRRGSNPNCLCHSPAEDKLHERHSSDSRTCVLIMCAIASGGELLHLYHTKFVLKHANLQLTAVPYI